MRLYKTTVLSMKKAGYCRWWCPTRERASLGLARYKMSRQTAREGFPGCEPDLGSREVRLLPETTQERAQTPADAPLGWRSK